MVSSETICGFGMANDSSIIHAALQKYMERKIKNVEDSITNKLVLRLPFESESKCSNLLLGHVNGIVCPMAQPPKNKDPMYASRSLLLTFKEKSSNFRSKKKAAYMFSFFWSILQLSSRSRKTLKITKGLSIW